MFHRATVKPYSEQSKRDVVTLYEATEVASLKSTAVELGINHITLENWVLRFSSNPRAGSTDDFLAAAITDAERIRQLEPDNT